MSNVKELKQFFQQRAIISVKHKDTDHCDTSIEQLSSQHTGYSWRPITNYHSYDQFSVDDKSILYSEQNNQNSTNIKLPNNCNSKHLVNNRNHNMMNDDDDGTSSISSFKHLIGNNNNDDINSTNNNHDDFCKVQQTIDQSDEYPNQFARGFNYITGQIGALVTPSEQKANNRNTSNLTGSHEHLSIDEPHKELKPKAKKSINNVENTNINQNLDQHLNKDSCVKKKQSSFASLASFIKRGTTRKNKKNKFKGRNCEGRSLLADFPILEEDTHQHNPSTQSNVSSTLYIDREKSNEAPQADSSECSANLASETHSAKTFQEDSERNTKSVKDHSIINSFETPIKQTKEPIDEPMTDSTTKSKSFPTPKPRKSLEKNNLLYPSTSFSKSNDLPSKHRQTSDPKVNMQQMIVNEFVMLNKRQSLLHMLSQNKETNPQIHSAPLLNGNASKTFNLESDTKSEKEHRCLDPPPLPPRSDIKTTHEDYINWEIVSNLKCTDRKTDQTERNDYYNELHLSTCPSNIDHHLFGYNCTSSSTSSSIDQSDSSDHSDYEEAIYETITEESIPNSTHESCEEKADSIVYSKVPDLPGNTLIVPGGSNFQNQSQSTPYKTIYPVDAINRFWSSSSEISSTLEDMTITPIRNSSPHHNCMNSIDNFMSCPYNKMDAYFKHENYGKLINKSSDNANIKGLFRIFKKREILALKSGEKFGLTGLEVPLCAGVVKDDYSRKSKHDLKLKKDEVVLVLRMHGNPPGKYLAKSEKGRIGYVDLSNLRVDSQSIKMILRVYGPTRCESVSFPVSEL